MITEKQYLKALKLVEQYKRQLLKPVVSSSFFINEADLDIMNGTIQVPKLTDKIVDENFASTVQDKIEIKGHSLDWVSLSDMGFISITFRDRIVTAEKIRDTLSVLNDC